MPDTFVWALVIWCVLTVIGIGIMAVILATSREATDDDMTSRDIFERSFTNEHRETTGH